jgi:hypothetical protein
MNDDSVGCSCNAIPAVCFVVQGKHCCVMDAFVPVQWLGKEALVHR